MTLGGRGGARGRRRFFGGRGGWHAWCWQTVSVPVSTLGMNGGSSGGDTRYERRQQWWRPPTKPLARTILSAKERELGE
uniref:Uncharacterized protein n=1 Tax=Oryza brachyantha TaxID=4533 RepID=J3LSC8_ORYBR